MTPDAMVLAMRTMAPAGGIEVAPVTLRLYDARRPDPVTWEFHTRTVRDRVVTDPGPAQGPAATVTADSTAWSEVLFGGRPLADAEETGAVRVEGRRTAVEQLVAAFGERINER
jgi:hypothetical protein